METANHESLKHKIRVQRNMLIGASIIHIIIYGIILSYISQDKTNFIYNDWRRLFIYVFSVIGFLGGVYFLFSSLQCPPV